jgi:CheY-like chemotaxis protein
VRFCLYKLCREGIFDDYILFWPVNEDTPRLSMSVHLALRELAATTANTPTTANFAAQARRLATSENILTAQITQGGARIDSLEQDVTQASNLASSAFDNFSQRLIQGDLREAIRADNVEELQHQLGHLKRDTIEAPLQALAKSVHPLKQWTSEFRKASAPHLESVRTLSALASTIRPMLLVVDDDPLQHKIIDSILKEENYRLLFASNSSETFNILRKKQPDLILMDVMMPDIDGVEMVRRIRIVPHLDETPILMITGRSQKDVILKSLEAGAKDIIVKPFVRDTLLGKIKHTLMNR